MLYRGSYELPHMSQVLGRDLCAEKILSATRSNHPTAHVYRRTPDQIGEFGIPYGYLIGDPTSAALSWQAFLNRDDFQVWLDAYGCRLDREPGPGENSTVHLPADGDASFQPLTQA